MRYGYAPTDAGRSQLFPLAEHLEEDLTVPNLLTDFQRLHHFPECGVPVGGFQFGNEVFDLEEVREAYLHKAWSI